MRAKTPVLFFALAVVLAAAAAWGAHGWINQTANRLAAQRAVMAPLVVAGEDIAPGQKLEAGRLALQRWPAGALPAGHFSSPQALEGRVAKTPLAKGEVILPAKLAERGAGGGLAAVLPEGYRAMTVRVDEVIGVGGFVQPGDRVDVLLTFAKGRYHDDPVTSTVLSDVPVITVGTNLEEVNRGGKPQTQKVKVVTLRLTPDQAERLALSSLEGKVILSLRNQGDRDGGSGQGVRLTALLGAAGEARPPEAAEPASPPAASTPAARQPPRPRVEVIKGMERSVQEM